MRTWRRKNLKRYAQVPPSPFPSGHWGYATSAFPNKIRSRHITQNQIRLRQIRPVYMKSNQQPEKRSATIRIRSGSMPDSRKKQISRIAGKDETASSEKGSWVLDLRTRIRPDHDQLQTNKTPLWVDLGSGLPGQCHGKRWLANADEGVQEWNIRWYNDHWNID